MEARLEKMWAVVLEGQAMGSGKRDECRTGTSWERGLSTKWQSGA